MQISKKPVYKFGDFRLDPIEKILWCGSKMVDVTPKAIEVLLVLLENAGRLVSKEEIFEQVWKDSFVEDANLSHHIFRLRKALGQTEDIGYIETIPKRGYRFTAAVETSSPIAPPLQPLDHRHSGARSGWLWPVVAALLSLVLTAAAFTWFRAERGAPPADAANVGDSVLTGQQAMKRLTDSGRNAAATISPDGRFIAYAQNALEGEGMLYIRQIETNRELPLLPPGEHNFGSVSFSPDGSFIYFIEYDKTNEGILYRVPVLGGQGLKVARGVHLMFSLTPDGARAVFFRRENKQTKIISAALDGSFDERTELILDDSESSITTVPAVSPDGRFISFGLGDAKPDIGLNQPRFTLHTLELATREIKQISDERFLEMGKSTWLPDGRGILFSGARTRSGNQIYLLTFPVGALHLISNGLNSFGNYGMGITDDGTTIVADLWDSSAQLWTMPSDGRGGEAEQITNGRSDGVRGLAALSSGEIVHSSRSGDEFDLWILSDRGGRREGRPITSDTFVEGEVCSAPDDSYLVFVSDRAGGTRHLFRSDVSGGNIQQLTFGDAIDASPDCGSDGNVYYTSTAAGNGPTSLMRVSASGGDSTRLVDYDCVSPAVSPDARFLSCYLPAGGPAGVSTIAIVSTAGGEPVKTFEVGQFAWRYRAPRWTPDGRGVTFVRSEKSAYNIWRQNIFGGAPKQHTKFRSDNIFNYIFSRTGQLVISRGKVAVDVVTIRNF